MFKNVCSKIETSKTETTEEERNQDKLVDQRMTLSHQGNMATKKSALYDYFIFSRDKEISLLLCN